MNLTKSEARMQTLTKMILGHAVEMIDSDNEHLRFRVGEHVFEDKRCEYPSERLIANISLAVEALGYSRGAFDIGDLGPEVIRAVMHHGRYCPDQGAAVMGRRIG